MRHVIVLSIVENPGSTVLKKWVPQAIESYVKRLSSYCCVTCRTVRLPSCMRGLPLTDVTWLQKQMKPYASATRIFLDARGEMLTSHALARVWQKWYTETKMIVFVIGPGSGFSEDCFEYASFVWSLSSLTFPHEWVPLLVVEQVYRVWSIHQNKPYHHAH